MAKKPKEPVRFSQEVADVVCELIGTGHSLRAIAAMPGMPTPHGVMKWLAKDEAFVAQYARAREMQADYMFNEITDIVDEPPMMTASGSVDSGDVAYKRLRMDARKWQASKLHPKKYGDKLEHEHTGADGKPIEHNLNISFVSPKKN